MHRRPIFLVKLPHHTSLHRDKTPTNTPKKQTIVTQDEALGDTICRVPDDQIAYRSYPLLAARELLQQFIREQVHGHQAA